ncbi:MAG: glycosyltransferase family 4 protein [Oscillospiraceae bacterium]|nr:glycosyltransferase family 4 protein [Oscillospiraceae bacterium]
MKENVALFDSSYEEAAEFIRGLQDQTGESWQAIVCNSNKGRQGLTNAIRYIKYFLFPLKIFFQRKRYGRIIGWQEFYGLVYAFYCRLFRVKKCNSLIIKNFIYKPKKGLVGKLYFRFMNYIVKSGYVDTYICASKTMVQYCCEVFGESDDRFVFIPFGVNDFAAEYQPETPPTNDYVLSLGRSNRDWQFLLDGIAGQNYPVKIICDELRVEAPPANVEILNSVWGSQTHQYIYNCKCMVIPIADGRIASGDTVLLMAMSFGKPIIITKPSCLADDYVTDGYNGIVIEKKAEQLQEAVQRIFQDEALYRQLSENGRQHYLEHHSLYTYGKNVGKIICARG